MVMVFVCLYDTAATFFTAEPSQSCRVYIQTISDLNRETLVVARLEIVRALEPPHFFPGTKRLFVDDMRQLVIRVLPPPPAPARRQCPDKAEIRQFKQQAAAAAVLGWGRLNKSKVTTGDDYLDKPYLVSVQRVTPTDRGHTMHQTTRH